MRPLLRATMALTVPLVLALPARAWAEARATSQDVRVSVDEKGSASVVARVGYRITGAPLRSLDVRGVDADVLEREVSLTSDEGAVLAAHAEMAGDQTARVLIDEPQGLRKGSYVISLRYRTELAARSRLRQEGALARLSFATPETAEGMDGVRVVFQLPAAKTEPRAVKAESDEVDATLATTLRRGPQADELELVRAHVARGERPVWSLRVDPRAFPSLWSERAPAVDPVTAAPPGFRRALLAGLAGAFGVILGLLAYGKHRVFARFAPGALQPLLPVAAPLAVTAAGVASAAGLLLQAIGSPVPGTLLLAFAMLAVVLRPAPQAPSPRGPGQWLPLKLDDPMFAPPPRTVRAFDASEPLGLAAFTGALVALLGTALAVAQVAPHLAHYLAADTLLLVPLFFAGRITQLPPGPARAALLLRRLPSRLRGLREAVRMVPWARLPDGEGGPDEVRLLVAPRRPCHGLAAVEVGVAWDAAGGTYAASPEVLVRVAAGSDAEDRLLRLSPGSRSLPGRKPDERVFVLRPRAPTLRGTAKLLTGLVDAFGPGAPAAEPKKKRRGAFGLALVNSPALTDTLAR